MRQGTAARLHAALPQTQCRRCGYADCAAYAQAMASGQAAINRCPPGGTEGLERLARITGQALQSLDPDCGQVGPRHLAVIDEGACIGCTRCIKVCPTDAIVGANKRMHTVIAPWCTGCALCVPACPVDCIGLSNVSGTATGWQAWSQPQADEALHRYQLHSNKVPADEDLAPKTPKIRAVEPSSAPPTLAGGLDADRKRALIDAARSRAQSRRPPSTGS